MGRIVHQRQFLLARRALYGCLSLESRAPIGMFLGVEHAPDSLRSSEVAADTILVLRKPTRNISRNARIDRAVFALEQIDEVRHLLLYDNDGALGHERHDYSYHGEERRNEGDDDSDCERKIDD